MCLNIDAILIPTERVDMVGIQAQTRTHACTNMNNFSVNKCNLNVLKQTKRHLPYTLLLLLLIISCWKGKSRCEFNL